MNISTIKKENFINLYNEKGERHGLWEIYYSNGRLSYRGNYVNCKEHGLYESYYSNGKLCYRGNYVNGEQHGLWESYYSNGQLHFRREYNMGELVEPVTELTLEEIAEKLGIPVNQIKIKQQ